MTKISDLTALAGAGVDTAVDLVPIVDMSAAGAARNKKITVAEFLIALGIPELARDTLGTALTAGANITITPNDGGDTITIAASSGGAIEALDEGVSLTASITSIDFVGAGVTASNSGGDVTVTIAGGGGYNAENARDDIGAALVSGTGAVVTVDDGSDTITIAASPSAIFEDQKAANTAGGTPTAGSWQTRTLNTEVYDDIGLTLSSNQISLAAGTYNVEAWSTIYRGGASRIRLRDVTNNVTLALSMNIFTSNNTSDGDMALPLEGRFTLAGTATVELQYRVGNAHATTGLGNLSNYGEVEVYSRLKLTKIS